MRVAIVLFLAGVAGAVHAADAPRCFEGTLGESRSVRHVFLIVDEEHHAELSVVGAELSTAAGEVALDEAVIRGTLARPDREIELEVTRVEGGLEGTMSDPEHGKIPLRLRRVEPYRDADRFVGTWSGRLEQFGLGLVVHVAEAPCGRLRASLDSPDQKATGMPATALRVTGDALHVAIEYLGAEFDGRLEEGGDRIAGQFRQAGVDQPLLLERGEQAASVVRPQEPKPPFPYRSEEVVVANDEAGLKLAGTLTIPDGDGPHPAVVFITGSGAQDRDETLMGHKPFLLLADTLTRSGLAVLRTDDRGIGGSEGNTLTSTLEDTASDVEAQLRFLRQRADIDARRVGLLGHSEGGWVAPIVENRDRGLAFVVMLAGPAVSGEELLYLQAAAHARALGIGEKQIDIVRSYNRMVFGILKKDLSDEETLERVLAGWERFLGGFGEEERPVVEAAVGIPGDASADEVRTQIGVGTTPWFRSLLKFDPKRHLKKMRTPVLALLGEKDVQVPADPNHSLFVEYLKAAKRDDVSVRTLPGLNHLFQEAATGVISEYGEIEETINPSALTAIRDWVTKQVR